MTPKEKAIEILKDFKKVLNNDFPKKENDAQYNFLAQCNGVILVNEILTALNAIEGQNESLYEEEKYWNEVKKEIEKL